MPGRFLASILVLVSSAASLFAQAAQANPEEQMTVRVVYDDNRTASPPTCAWSC